ncbi:PAS domain S-box protein [Kovacikia minuta CCNUW1]|uniref:PAS domain S-box protein n=1 Tax=Kovacikia minuta TaxID=2931930 RepID=UPI001CCA88C7|nr:PAS domain S-box protein [Kovacikia minuta]UBF26771.1 PAS domain S-box protein [Kovacikia minuta CCNUW1]
MPSDPVEITSGSLFRHDTQLQWTAFLLALTNRLTTDNLQDISKFALDYLVQITGATAGSIQRIEITGGDLAGAKPSIQAFVSLLPAAPPQIFASYGKPTSPEQQVTFPIYGGDGTAIGKLILEVQDLKQLQAATIHDEIKVICQIIATVMEREETEQALQWAEAQLQLSQFSLQHMSDACFWLGADGQFELVNEAACKHLGYSQQELLALKVSDIDPNFPLETWSEFWANHETWNGSTFESLHWTRQGDLIPVEITGNYLEFRGKEYCFTSVQNIRDRKHNESQQKHLEVLLQQTNRQLERLIEERTTDLETAIEQLKQEIGRRQQAQTALLESEQRYRSVVAALQEGVILQDATGAIHACNDSAERILGISCSQILSGNALDLQLNLINEEGEAFPAALHPGWVTLKTGRPCSDVVMGIQKPEGAVVWVSVNSQPLFRRGETQPYATVLSFTDITDRKHTQKQLQNALRHLNFHFENSPLAVIEWDADLRITRWVGEAEAIFGWNSEEVWGKQLDQGWRFVYDADREAVAESINQLFGGHLQRNVLSYRNYTKTGGIVHCEWYNSVLRDEAGNVISLLSLVQNVTDRKLAEEELEWQGLRSRLFADISLKIRQSLHLENILQTTVTEVRELLLADRVLIYQLFPDGAGMVMTEAIVPGFNSLVGMRFSPEVFPVDYHAPYRQGRIASIDNIETAGLTPCHQEFLNQLNVKAKLVVPLIQGADLWGLMIVHQCGTTRQWSGFEIELLQQLADQVGIALGQAQLLQALRASEEKFRQITENIQQVFWMRNPLQNQVIYVSPAYEQIWGYPCTSVYDDSFAWSEIIHPEDRDRVMTLIKNRHSEFDQEYRICRADGTLRWIRDRAFPIRDETGKIGLITGIAEDITDRKQLEEELLKTLEKEKELSELKSRFVAMTSHEFRTPLSTILSASELLEYYEHRWSEEERLEQLHLIQDTVQHMTQLLEDILLIGQAEADRLEFYPTPIDLNQFCLDLVAQIQGSIGKQHQLIYNRQCSIEKACVDEKLLRQILTNLLSNGVKYSPIGSQVQLEVARDTKAIIFRVQDWGIGIPAEECTRLFEAFHRAKNVGTIPGTGLGLTIVQRCVNAHNGSITFQSEVGVGSLFEVRLPLED